MKPRNNLDWCRPRGEPVADPLYLRWLAWANDPDAVYPPESLRAEIAGRYAEGRVSRASLERLTRVDHDGASMAELEAA